MGISTESASSRRCGRLIFCMMFGAYAFSYLGRNTFSACLKVMAAQGLFPDGFDGYISAAYLILYGSGQLINGLIVTKVSPKIMCAAGLFGSGLCNLLMTVTQVPALYMIVWGANGFFCAMMWPSVVAVFAGWLNAEERGSAAVNISPSIPVGSILGYLISFAGLSGDTGVWKPVFLISGTALLCGGGLWVAVNLAFRRQIDEKIAETAQKNREGTQLSAGNPRQQRFTLATVFLTGLTVMVVASVFNGALKEAVNSYAPSYISETFGYSPEFAALVCTFLPVVAVAGPYFGKWIYKKVKENECTTVGILMGVSALCNLGIAIVNLFSPAPRGLPQFLPSLLFLAVSSACMWGVNNMLMAFTPFHYNKMGASTVVSGILNGTVFLGSAVFTVLYRNVRDASENWDKVVLLWVGCGIVCCAVSLFFAANWRKKRPTSL